MIRTALATAALMLATTGVASAEPTQEFVFDAEPHAAPINSRAGHWTPPELELRIGFRQDNALRVAAEYNGLQDWFDLELSRADGQPLTEGAYTDVKVRVISGGFFCVDQAADVTVEKLERAADGSVDTFYGAVEHRCQYSSDPDNALRMKIRFSRS
jgi:hypothetical protein